MYCCNLPEGFLHVCGQMTDPVNPDQGHSHPPAIHFNGEAPVLPSIPCNDSEAYIVFDPNVDPPFRASSILFDITCDPFTDSNNQPLRTYSV